MSARIVVSTIVCAALLGASATGHAESQRFADGAAIGESLLEVKVVDALHRADGRWLTLGSRVDSESRETPYLILRTNGGEHAGAVALAADDGLSWSPRSVLPAGGGNDVIVLGIEYDHRDFGALSGLFLARLDGELDVVWSRHLQVPGLWFETASLRAAEGQAPVVVGIVQNVDDGIPDAGDAFVAGVDADTGELVSPRAFGTPDGRERVADSVITGAGAQALLVEVQRSGPSGLESADGLVTLDTGGAIASTRLVGHTLAVGVRAQPLRLMRDGDSWVLAGRRTSLGPNFYYLHRLADDFTPAATRTLIPFFNAMDVAVHDGSVLLYGEANGEVFDRGSVLMRLDADFAIDLQRRYVTENQVFPTGAFAFGDNGILLALGAMRDEDGFVYESVTRVSAADGTGMLCDEESYDGFGTSSDAPSEPAAWAPAMTSLDVQTTAAAATAAPLTPGEVALCAAQDELMFRHGFETET
jgi:hypothetical protein